MATYTPNTPRGTDTPAATQPLIEGNFQYLIPSIGFGLGNGLQQDHQMLLLNGAGDGTHRQVTYANNQTTPGITGGVSVTYTNTANGGSQLFFNNALADVQLTSAIAGVPTAPAITGATFLPGGFLLQWGQQLNAGSQVVMFPKAFNGATFQPVVTVGSASGGVPLIAGPAFDRFTAIGNTYFWWMAIGQAP